MQINALNNNQKNTNFKAKLELSGSALLNKSELRQIQKKVAKLGTKADVIQINLKKHTIIDNRQFFGPYQQVITKTMPAGEYTSVLISHHCPSLNNYGTQAPITVEGNEKERKNKAFDIIDRYIDHIKNFNKN